MILEWCLVDWEIIVTKNDRVKIKKELYEVERKKNLSDKEKEKIDDNLYELVNKLNKKEKYRYHDHDDLDCHGIRDIENLFDANNNEDYYKRILVKSSFNESYKCYESRGDKDKKLSIEQYLDMIKPYLSDLINENKAIETSSNEWKIQMNMHINFFLQMIQEKFVLFLCGVIMMKLGWVMKQMILLKDLLILS